MRTGLRSRTLTSSVCTGSQAQAWSGHSNLGLVHAGRGPAAGVCRSQSVSLGSSPAPAEANQNPPPATPSCRRPWHRGSFWPRTWPPAHVGEHLGLPSGFSLQRPFAASGPSFPTAAPLGLTASTRLPALPWKCRPQAPAWLGTVRDTGRARRGAPLPPPQGVGSPDQEPQWTDGKLLLSFSLDSVPSSRRVGMGFGGQPRLPGVAGGVAHGLGNVVGEWLLCRRGLRPATANACRHTGSTRYGAARPRRGRPRT